MGLGAGVVVRRKLDHTKRTAVPIGGSSTGLFVHPRPKCHNMP